MEKNDLKQSKLLTEVLSGKKAVQVKALVTDNSGREYYLFYYKRFYYFEGTEMKKVTEAEVTKMLLLNSLIQIFCLCSDPNCNIPDILLGRQKAVMRVKDDAEAIEFMNSKTGAKIKKLNMGNVDLNESKRLSRVLAGKEAPKDRSKEILARMKGKTGFRASADEIPGLETKSFLFYFSGKYYHVKGVLKKITAADVKPLLKDYSDTQIYFLCAMNVCPMPSELSGKKMTSAKVKDAAGAAQYMTEKSGVTITKNDL